MGAQRDDAAGRIYDRAYRITELVMYTGVSVLLVVGAVAVLADAGRVLLAGFGDGVDHAVQEMLDRLLLVFILIELLSAVRTTLDERRLVAEPFLLVGIIVTIKELVVISISAREALGKEGEEFTHSMQALGVLTVLLLGLAVSTLLVRRKEREPEEVQGRR